MDNSGTRVGYRFGFFCWYSVGISWFLPNRYRRKTRSVHFGIIILAGTPFFLKRGVTAYFFRGPAPILRKKGFPAKPLRVPAKFFSAQNTDRNTDQPAPVYGISIPIHWPNCQYQNGIQLYWERCPCQNLHGICTELARNLHPKLVWICTRLHT
jgi:hypothetical protein